MSQECHEDECVMNNYVTGYDRGGYALVLYLAVSSRQLPRYHPIKVTINACSTKLMENSEPSI